MSSSRTSFATAITGKGSASSTPRTCSSRTACSGIRAAPALARAIRLRAEPAFRTARELRDAELRDREQRGLRLANLRPDVRCHHGDCVDGGFENCTTRGTSHGSLSIATSCGKKGPVQGTIDFSHCRFEDAGRAGLTVTSNSVRGVKIRLADCTLADAADKPSIKVRPSCSPRVRKTQKTLAE